MGGLCACGSSPGGLGIGFANTDSSGRTIGPALRITRVYLPQDANQAPYVELGNDTNQSLDWTATPLVLLGTGGKAALPTSGTWPENSAWQLGAQALAPLGLTASKGELLLAEADLTPLAYVAWGMDANALRSGLAGIARQADLPIPVAYPLPVPMSDGQALYFGGEASEQPSCCSADPGAALLTPAACLLGP